jgi:hypothetical protein
MRSNLPARYGIYFLALLSPVPGAMCFPQNRIEEEFSAKVSKTRLLDQVRELVKLGSRAGGTASGDKSVSYVARKFTQAGFSPRVQIDPLRLAFDLKRWSLIVQDPAKLRRLIKREWVGAYSPSVPNSTAELLYVRDPQKFSNRNLKGKALLVDNPVSAKVYQSMADHGARCLLVASPVLEGAYSDWAMIADLPPGKDRPIPLFNVSANNARDLLRALQDSQRVMIRFSTETGIDSARPKTVIATLEGESEQYYLICAHGDSDSGGPGADDNASGVSGVLETARILKDLVVSRRIPKPKFSVRFVVWGTEMFSAEQYVRLNAHHLKDILGVLNLDEIGTGATRNCLYFESNDVRYNEPLLRTLEHIGDEYAGRRGYWSEATTNPSQGGTDSYVFFPSSLRQLKVLDTEIPSITIFTCAWNELKAMPQTSGWNSKSWRGPLDTVYVDYSAYYHSSLDVPERTTEREPFNMSGAVKAVGIALLRLAW